MIMVGDAAVKIREEVIVILHPRPPLARGVVFHADSECPYIACIVKVAGAIRRVT